MSRWILRGLLAVVLVALAACATPSVDEDGADEVEVTLAATVAATPTESEPAAPTTEAYPASPAPTLVPEDYPADSPPATVAPSAYPADTRVSILRPLGNQCQAEDEYQYATLEDAVTALEAAGVEVFASDTTSLIVCEACDCPISEHFQAEILRSDLEEAQTLGWYEGVGEQ